MAKISERYLNDPVYKARVDKERWSKKVICEWMNNGFKDDVRENDDFKEAIRFYIGTGLGTGGRKGQNRDEILAILAYTNRINKERWSKKVIREWMNGGFVEDVRENADFKEAIRFYIGNFRKILK